MTKSFTATLAGVLSFLYCATLAVAQDNNLFPGDVSDSAGPRSATVQFSDRELPPIRPSANGPTKVAAPSGVAPITNNTSFPEEVPPVSVNIPVPTESTRRDLAKPWQRFFRTPATLTDRTKVHDETLLRRWNSGTKKAWQRTKAVLTPHNITPPKFELPKLNRSQSFPNSNLRPAGLKRTDKNKKQNIFTAMFPKREKQPPKPQTIPDFLGLQRPE